MVKGLIYILFSLALAAFSLCDRRLDGLLLPAGFGLACAGLIETFWYVFTLNPFAPTFTPPRLDAPPESCDHCACEGEPDYRTYRD